MGGMATMRRMVWPSLAALLIAASPASAGETQYSYDKLGRLIEVRYSNGVVVTYTYDAKGNRLLVRVTGAGAAPADSSSQ